LIKVSSVGHRESPRSCPQAPPEARPPKVSVSLGKGDVVQTPPTSGLRRALEGAGGQQQEQEEIQEEEQEEQEQEEEEEEVDEGDSFFDDPLPQPQKTYGW